MTGHGRHCSGEGGTGHDAGVVSLLLAVLFSAAVLFAGLIYDVGRVQHASGDAFDLSGEAARAGAQQIDVADLDQGEIRLDRAAATRAATAYLTSHDAAGRVTVEAATVTVTVTEHVPYRLLAVLHPGGATVTQTRSAIATAGP